METLEAENVEFREENVKLKTNFKKLKLKVENLEKKIQSKQEELCEKVEPKVSFPKTKRSPEIDKNKKTKQKKSQNISNKNGKALTKPLPTTCVELRARGHFADGIYLLADSDTNQINAYSCEFLSAADSKIPKVKVIVSYNDNLLFL